MEQTPDYDRDELKRLTNIRDHKIDFTAAREFDWDKAAVFIDDRADYGELREIAIGFIGVRLHVLVFTRRRNVIRIISLWRAQKSDVRRYVQAIG